MSAKLLIKLCIPSTMKQKRESSAAITNNVNHSARLFIKPGPLSEQLALHGKDVMHRSLAFGDRDYTALY